MIRKIQKVSDLPILKRVLKNGQTVVAYERLNYNITLDQIKGDRIEDIEWTPATGDNRYNIMTLVFDDGTRKKFGVYNGATGEIGETGNKGATGDKGETPKLAVNSKYVLNLVHDEDTDKGIGETETFVWSAERAKLMDKLIRQLNNIVVSDAEYQLLFNNPAYLKLTFTTDSNNKTTQIFNDDTNEHTTYVKYFTIEETDSNSYYTYDEATDTYTAVDSNFDVWRDCYLGDGSVDYYTRKMVIGDFNPNTESYDVEYVYTKVLVPVWVHCKFETAVEDVTTKLINASKELGSEDKPIKEKEEDIIVVEHKAIKSISLSKETVKYAVNTINRVDVFVDPIDYINSPIGIEYDDEKITIFEDGRIMAIETDCETDVKIYSVENPKIFVILHITIFTPVSKIIFDSTSIAGFASTEHQINATIEPSDATYKDIVWSSLDEKIATVDNTGKVKLIGTYFAYDEVAISDMLDNGTYYIADVTGYKEVTKEYIKENPEDTYYSKTKITSTAVTATSTDGEELVTRIPVSVSIPVEEIVFDKDSYELLVSTKSTRIDPKVLPEDATNQNIEWISSDPDILFVSARGDIIPKAKGKATLTAKSTDTTDVVSIINIENKIGVNTITLNQTDVSLDLGDSVQLTATVEPVNADNKKLEWSSSNELIATVNQAGLVKTLIGGDVVITAKATDGSGVSASCNIASVVLIKSITLSETNVRMHVGDTYQIDYTVTPDNAYKRDLIWRSSDESVATVDSNGLVTALSEGYIKIYAMADDNSGIISSANFMILVDTQSVVLNASELNLNVGESYDLIATVKPDNASNQFISFESSDDDIATVSQSGHIVALKSGKATITARTTDGSDKSAICPVIIK